LRGESQPPGILGSDLKALQEIRLVDEMAELFGKILLRSLLASDLGNAVIE
jgi:hypothetical protein